MILHLIFVFNCVSVCLSVWVHTLECRCWKNPEALEPPGAGMIDGSEIPSVGSGHWTQVFCRSNTRSYLLGHLSRLIFFFPIFFFLLFWVLGNEPRSLCKLPFLDSLFWIPFVFFETESCYIALPILIVCRTGWPQTPAIPVTASQVLGLQ